MLLTIFIIISTNKPQSLIVFSLKFYFKGVPRDVFGTLPNMYDGVFCEKVKC